MRSLESADPESARSPVPAPGTGPEGPGRAPRPVRGLAWACLALLLLGHCAGHLDALRSRPARLLGGWLPEELAWRLGWMGLAFLWLVLACRILWRPREEDGSGAGEGR